MGPERAWLGCGEGAVGSLGCCSLVRTVEWAEGSFQRELMCWLGRASEEQGVRLVGKPGEVGRFSGREVARSRFSKKHGWRCLFYLFVPY